MMARALVLAPFSDDGLASLRRCLDVTYESWIATGKLWDPVDLGERLRDTGTSVLIVEPDFVFEEVFELASRLELVGVCRATTGHVEVDAATLHGVLVVNTPARNSQAVAEHVLGLMLSLARRLPAAHAYVASGGWDHPIEPYVAMRGVELSGRVLGVVGLGAIGRRIAAMAGAIGMQVVAADPFIEAPPDGVELVSMEDLMSRADFITIHVPLGPDTEGMLDPRRLSLMKRSAYLVNTSEAGIVDGPALVEALRSRRIAGAALDVFETHPIAPDNPLLGLDNVVLTPHIGGATEETVQRHSRMMADDVARFISGVRPLNIVNPQAWKPRE